jgi:hypothetical protein
MNLKLKLYLRIIVSLILLTCISIPAIAQARLARRAATKPGSAAEQPQSNPTQQLPLHRVILYSNGVAYFERRGTVTGHAEINLPFKQSQVDDVLKSMVVIDLGKGRIGAVSYNSSAPPAARLADIPFSIAANTDEEEGGLMGVLTQLQGARVVVTTANRTTTGAILTVDEKKSQIDANKPPSVTRSLVVASESGELINFDLAEVRSVKLLDEGARHDVNEFAAASAAARRRDAKTITVTSEGEGSRELVVSYTVAAPIWKTSYRVVLDAAGKPFFQGWAIIDNVSEEDWTDVRLSLVSGSPVSFIQPIQQPMYRYRPVIAIPSGLNLEPQMYQPDEVAGVGGTGLGSGPGLGPRSRGVPGGTPGGVLGGVPAQRPNQPLSQNTQNFQTAPRVISGENTNTSSEPVRSISDLITAPESGVETAASGTEVGDLFEYNIDQPITLRRNRSALIPIVQARLDGVRVSVFNESVRKDRPLSGLRLRNTSALTLEGGSVTVIDGDAYAGEALMDRLKPGEDRFVSFALDLGTLVTTRSKTDREPVFFIRVVNGVFQAHFHQTEQKTYRITNQTERPRIVYVEHPVRKGWVLSDDTPKPASKTASVYRFRLELEPRKTAELIVTERLPMMDTYALTGMTSQQVELFVSKHYVDDQTRAALELIVDLRTKLSDLQARVTAANEETQEIGNDQARLRENIKALKDTAETKQLIARYVAKAGEQESRLEQLDSEKKQTTAEIQRIQQQLSSAIRELALDRKLSSE